VAPGTQDTSRPAACSMRWTVRAARAIGSRSRVASMIIAFACAVRILRVIGWRPTPPLHLEIVVYCAWHKRSFLISCMRWNHAEEALQPAAARPDPGLRGGRPHPLLH